MSVTSGPTSLYVGDLHPEVTDAQLFAAFSEFQSLASVRVCRDMTTGRSLCYGFVNFLSHQDANQAIEVKNHSALNAMAIRVTWSYRDPMARKTGIANVFVKNLNESVDNAKLQELFQKFGSILSCKVVMSEDAKSKGFGFVQFEHEESAKTAIKKLNDIIFEGKQLYVGKFVRKSDRASSGPDAKYTNLYVKNLDSDVSEELLKEKFSEFGKIVSLVISKDENGNSKGFGFVNFDSPDDARRAMETMNGSQLGSMVLYVARAQKRSEREQILRRQFEDKRKEHILKYQASNVYVKNINDEVNDNELREQFSQCGTITSAKLMRDEKGMSKGFGFVCFSTPEEANKAVTSFHGFMFHGKPLYVAIAQKKEERQAQLQLQYAQHVAGLTGQSAVFPGGYPPYYYTAPPGVISQVSQQPGLMYQPLAMRPDWGVNGFGTSSRPAFTPPHFPMISNHQRQNRQHRGRVNRHLPLQGGAHNISYVPHLQQTPQLLVSSNDASNHQWAGHAYVPNGRAGTTASYVLPNSDGTGGSEMLSSRLAAAAPDQQKKILGDRLLPLVNQLKPDLAEKITGMLLEMDNTELLWLLESPESLSAKVENAVEELQNSKAKASGQEALHPSYLSAEVAVN